MKNSEANLAKKLMETPIMKDLKTIVGLSASAGHPECFTKGTARKSRVPLNQTCSLFIRKLKFELKSNSHTKSSTSLKVFMILILISFGQLLSFLFLYVSSSIKRFFTKTAFSMQFLVKNYNNLKKQSSVSKSSYKLPWSLPRLKSLSRS